MKVPTPSYSATADPNRVSNLELFFDLVFVFTITQLTSLLARDPTITGIAQVQVSAIAQLAFLLAILIVGIMGESLLAHRRGFS